jgi:hypothetical protein
METQAYSACEHLTRVDFTENLKQVILLFFGYARACVLNLANDKLRQWIVVNTKFYGTCVSEFKSILKQIHKYLSNALRVQFNDFWHPLFHMIF